MNLDKKINNKIFYPEVYVYPTPRCYKPLKNIDFNKINFGEAINLYIHIPFCKSVCSYCGYLKIIDNDKVRADYIEAVIMEILSYKQIFKNKIVNTVHLGGGTPTLLSNNQIEKIFKILEIVFPNFRKTATEISIEGTPNSIAEEKMDWYLSLGFNRVSLGVQTFCASELLLARRIHNNSDMERAVKILRSKKVPNIVFDLMAGIAGQTAESFKQSVMRAIEFRPDTVEIYALGIMPYTSWHNNNKALMTNEDIYRCYELAMKLFLGAGYAQDCHNRYVLPGRGSFFQEDNVFKGETLIGFGAGARTYTPNMHYRNNYSADNHCGAVLKYIENINKHKSPIEDGCKLSPEEIIRQYAIYNIEKLDLAEFEKRFKISFEDFFGPLLKTLIKHKLGKISERRFSLNKKGLLFRDLIAHELYSTLIKNIEENYRPIV